VPPGISGMKPELSINYNSNSGNGLLGVGFGLGGLSAIHRLVASSVLMRFNNASVLIVNSLLSILIFIIVNHSLPRQTALLLRWTVLLLG
jgi:hypothetical protein